MAKQQQRELVKVRLGSEERSTYVPRLRAVDMFKKRSPTLHETPFHLDYVHFQTSSQVEQ